MRNKGKRKWLAALVSVCLAVTAVFGGAGAVFAAEIKEGEAPVFDADGKHVLVDEAENFSGKYLYNGNVVSDLTGYWTAGRIGKGLRVDNKATVEDYTAAPAITGNAFTFMTWVKIKDAALGNQSLMSIFSVAGAPTGGFFNVSPNYAGGDNDHKVDGLNGLMFEGGNWDAARNIVYNPVAEGENNKLPQDVWSHVAVTANGTTLALYRDGDLVAQKASSLTIGTIQKLILGDFFGMKVNAVYDNTLLYNKALSDTEIAAIFDADNAQPIPPDEGGDPQPPASGFDANGRYVVVGEQENFKDSVFRGEDRLDDSSSLWVDGKNGKGLELAGNGDSVRFNPDIFNEDIDGFTFSTWLYWKGDPNPDDEGGLLWQRMFCISGKSGYMNFSPWGNEDSKFTSDDGLTHLDGMVMAGGKYNEDANCYVPVEVGTEGKNHIAIDEWSHIALTVDGEKIKIYVNGKLFAEQWCDMEIWELNNVDLARLGSAFFASDPFYGIFDDTMVHNKALSESEVKALFTEQGGVFASDTNGDGKAFPTWAIVVCSVGGAAVLGGGGFCLYWFVFRKKKLA